MNCNSKRFTTNCRRILGAALLLLVWTVGNTAAQAQQASPLSRVDLEQAIQLALKHNHALKAAENTIQQSEAQEITAAIRPNPVFTYDDLYIPLFSPGQLNTSTLDQTTEFDLGLSYIFERGHKRQARINAAKDATAVTRSQVKDTERSLTFNVAQQFVNVLQAKADLDLANQDLASFQQTVDLSQSQYQAGAISEGDLLKIKLQLLQFQTDVSAAKLALVQSKLGLPELVGFESVPADYDVLGDLAHVPLHGNQEDLQVLALKQRPDLQAAVRKAVSLPQGYHMEWGGEYSEFLAAKTQLNVIGPVTVLLIFFILFALYGNFKFPVTIALGVVMTEPVGALLALKLTHTPFSVSSVLGLPALMGVSVETAVILVSHINKLRLDGKSIRDATYEASLLRLRPIMMTALVACLGLLPAALSHGIGSDTQRPFAMVIVAGLISRLLLGFFLNPVLYELVAKEGDVLQVGG